MSDFTEVIKCKDCKFRNEDGQCLEWPCWSFPYPEVPEDGFCYRAEKETEVTP